MSNVTTTNKKRYYKLLPKDMYDMTQYQLGYNKNYAFPIYTFYEKEYVLSNILGHINSNGDSMLLVECYVPESDKINIGYNGYHLLSSFELFIESTRDFWTLDTFKWMKNNNVKNMYDPVIFEKAMLYNKMDIIKFMITTCNNINIAKLYLCSLCDSINDNMAITILKLIHNKYPDILNKMRKDSIRRLVKEIISTPNTNVIDYLIKNNIITDKDLYDILSSCFLHSNEYMITYGLLRIHTSEIINEFLIKSILLNRVDVLDYIITNYKITNTFIIKYIVEYRNLFVLDYLCDTNKLKIHMYSNSILYGFLSKGYYDEVRYILNKYRYSQKTIEKCNKIMGGLL